MEEKIDLWPKTLIYSGEADRMAGWIQEYPDLETGGDLFGFWTHSGSPVVQFALGPGPGSRHNISSFFQDRAYLIEAADVLRSRHGLQHIGEWHSHHQLGLAEPSDGDEGTIRNALDRYNFPRFALCIATLHAEANKARKKSKKRKWTVNIASYLFTRSEANYKAATWWVLPEESPIRVALKKSLKTKYYKLLFRDPDIDDSWSLTESSHVPRTEAVAQPYNPSKDAWYGKENGKSLLKEIYYALRGEFKDCRMYVVESEQIAFTFRINMDEWRVHLPNDFPHSPPLIQVNSEETFMPTNWQRGDELLQVILAHLKRYYGQEDDPYEVESIATKEIAHRKKDTEKILP